MDCLFALSINRTSYNDTCAPVIWEREKRLVSASLCLFLDIHQWFFFFFSFYTLPNILHPSSKCFFCYFWLLPLSWNDISKSSNENISNEFLSDRSAIKMRGNEEKKKENRLILDSQHALHRFHHHRICWFFSGAWSTLFSVVYRFGDRSAKTEKRWKFSFVHRKKLEERWDGKFCFLFFAASVKTNKK